jgi:hypothetical protein
MNALPLDPLKPPIIHPTTATIAGYRTQASIIHMPTSAAINVYTSTASRSLRYSSSATVVTA